VLSAINKSPQPVSLLIILRETRAASDFLSIILVHIIFFFYLILLSRLLFRVLFIYHTASSLCFLLKNCKLFYRPLHFSSLCLSFHLSTLFAWLIYGHLFCVTLTCCRAGNKTTAVTKAAKFFFFFPQCRSGNYAVPPSQRNTYFHRMNEIIS
jgi:hypothetical protein